MARPLPLSGRPEAPRVYRVGELNREVRDVLEDTYGSVWVEGELSEVRRHGSGHVYFTLNDPKEVAQLRGVMFRSDAVRAKARLERGEAVRLQGQLTVYPERGQYQLVARIAHPAGAGDLHARFERIKAKLAAEGLLATERKRPLPAYPTTVGVVTSAQGAAMHDIVRVSHGRFPVRLVVSDCRVQGESAPAEIVAALRRVEQLEDLDVIVVARGGGSGEDLWAFNHEAVARAIAGARVPVVVGVGHETDVTLADLVADARAATPSNAAELVLPERAGVEARMSELRHRLERGVAMRIDRERLRLTRVERSLGDPRTPLRTVRQAIHQTRISIEAAIRGALRTERERLRHLGQRLGRRDARRRLTEFRRTLGACRDDLRRLAGPAVARQRDRFAASRTRLLAAAVPLVRGRRERLGLLTARLEAMDPYRVLERGYAIALFEGTALMDAERARPGDVIDVRLRRGTLRVRVESAERDADAAPAREASHSENNGHPKEKGR